MYKLSFSEIMSAIEDQCEMHGLAVSDISPALMDATFCLLQESKSKEYSHGVLDMLINAIGAAEDC